MILGAFIGFWGHSLAQDKFHLPTEHQFVIDSLFESKLDDNGVWPNSVHVCLQSSVFFPVIWIQLVEVQRKDQRSSFSPPRVQTSRRQAGLRGEHHLAHASLWVLYLKIISMSECQVWRWQSRNSFTRCNGYCRVFRWTDTQGQLHGHVQGVSINCANLQEPSGVPLSGGAQNPILLDFYGDFMAKASMKYGQLC